MFQGECFLCLLPAGGFGVPPGRGLCVTLQHRRQELQLPQQQPKIDPSLSNPWPCCFPSFPREHPVLQFMLIRHFQSLRRRMKCKVFLINRYCYSLSFKVFCILTEQAERQKPHSADPVLCHGCLLHHWDPSSPGFRL